MKPATQSVDDAIGEITNALAGMNVAIQRLIGEANATRCVLDTVITTHPRPAVLRAAWEQATAALTEALVGSDDAPNAMTLAGWTRVLAHYSELIEAIQPPSVPGPA